ncbi:MAG: hypothetical protein QOD75_324 [Blastocatellia bacterium]|nr:hypothetical protein [Blastocatellia bacterium]
MKYILVGLMMGLISSVGVAQSVRSDQSAEITEVTLEMNPGSSTSARDFRIVLRSDGTASYEGRANVKLQGKYQGLFAKEDFAQLAKFVSEHHFGDLTSFPSSKAATVTFSELNSFAIAAPTIRTSILQNTKRITIERPVGVKINNPKPPPKDLLDIENAITTAATRIKWDKVKK